MFNMLSKNHIYNTRATTFNLIYIPQVRTSHFGVFSIRFKTLKAWNLLQRNLNMDILNCGTSDFKKSLFQTHSLPTITMFKPQYKHNLIIIVITYYLIIFNI